MEIMTVTVFGNLILIRIDFYVLFLLFLLSLSLEMWSNEVFRVTLIYYIKPLETSGKTV